ncbi:MAG: indole-3-glycerol phosphate synthase TrpC [Gemmatimonadota bacterium]
MPETQGHDSLPGILAEIVAHKRAEVEELRDRMDAVERAVETARPPLDFHEALRGGSAVSLIAECKRRSPGAGDIRPGLDPVALTLGYAQAGASALSILTDERFFGGSLGDLEAVTRSVPLPALRKDFTLDTSQIIEARAGGADAVLLIARILDDDSLRRLTAAAHALGMGALIEVHDAVELERALASGSSIIGINNRDLSTFTTDLDTTARLLEGLPDHVTVVSESGIRTREDVQRLGAMGVDAILVGEAIVGADAPSSVASDLAGVSRVERFGA